MSGTVEGGKAAADTNKALYGEDFYKKIGAKGGRLGHTGGFYGNREAARKAGKLGGKISRRGKIKTASLESWYKVDSSPIILAETKKRWWQR